MDFREHYRDYAKATPYFAPGSTSLIEGFARRPDVEVHAVHRLEGAVLFAQVNGLDQR